MVKKKDKSAPRSENERKETQQTEEERARAQITGANRIHFEGLGTPWRVLLGGNVAKLMPQVVGTVLQAGGSRPSWHWQRQDMEYYLMAWPKEQPVRAAVLVSGKKGDKLRPVDAFPMLQGLPNDLTVETVHPWKQGRGANVAALVREGLKPMWFYDPFYERDREDLTPGVTQTFLIAGLAFMMRKALLDNLTITRGPYYEAHAEKWLEEHPGARPLEVPPLQIPMTGRHIIMPGGNFAEYQLRAVVDQVEQYELDKMPVTLVYMRFPFDEGSPLLMPVYASREVLGDYEPKAGDEVDAYVWLQGRVIDMEDPGQAMPEGFVRDSGQDGDARPDGE